VTHPENPLRGGLARNVVDVVERKLQLVDIVENELKIALRHRSKTVDFECRRCRRELAFPGWQQLLAPRNRFGSSPALYDIYDIYDIFRRTLEIQKFRVYVPGTGSLAP
jgi:hypothetical protein